MTDSILSRTILLPILAACSTTLGCGDNQSLAPELDAPTAPADTAPDGPPPPPSLQFYDLVQAIDVTPDGKTAVFGDISTPDNKIFFIDTLTHEAVFQTSVGDALRGFATGVSNTRAITALHVPASAKVQAGVWSAATNWTDIASPHATGCGEDVASAWDISADGTVVIGSSWNTCAVEAFRWSSGTLTRLEVIGVRTGGGAAPPDNRPSVISDNGAFTAGFAMTGVVDRAPAYWTADGKGHFLSRSADDAPGEVLAINADGTVFAGLDGLDSVVWSGGERTMIPRLDILLPSDPVFANVITGDGKVVFGAQGSAFFGPQEAFVWSSANGLRKLSDLVIAAGLTIPADESLANVTGASADGTVLIGTIFNPNTNATRGFVLRLPIDAIE